METFDISILENLSEEPTEEEINRIFLELCEEIQESLNLEIIDSNINIIYRKGKYDSESQKENILDLGVQKKNQNESLTIEIFDEYKKYLPIFLLREAYYCFVPYNLKENEGIKIIINQIVEINLDKFEIINEWELLVKENIVDYNFLTSEFDRLEKFLRLNASETTESSIRMFFQYIRKNILLIEDETDDLYDNILKDFILKTSKSLNNNEVIETLRILIEIFYKVKSYGALLEYQQYFTQFKKSGEIKTDLSLRKFSSNMRWINKFSYIAPSYQINWKSINVGIIYCKFRFNPLLRKTDIDLIIEKLPFFVMSKSSEAYFAVEISGWFVFPLLYQKDLFNFLEKLEGFGYVINKNYILCNTDNNFLNLNYFREFYRKHRIINPNHINYDKKYEIDFNLKFNQHKNIIKLSILDYVILNRIGYFSFDGFSFERRAETLKKIKSDLFNEILSRTRLIRKLKETTELFHNDFELKKSFLHFLKTNKNFGFFYTRDFLSKITFVLKLIKKIFLKNPDLRNIFQFQESIKKKDSNLKIDDIIALNNKSIKKRIYQDWLPLYFQNKGKFKEEMNKFRTFKKMLDYSYRLKIFDLNSLIKIIEDKHIIQKIYSVKELRLRSINRNYRLQNISSREIDEILSMLSNDQAFVIKPYLINTIMTTTFAKYHIELILKDSLQIGEVIDSLKQYFPRIINESGCNLYHNEELRFVEIFLPNINEKKQFISILFNLFRDNIISLKRFFYDGFIKSYEIKDFYDLDKHEFFYTKDLFEQYFIYVQKVFGNKLKTIREITSNNQEIFWSPEKDFNSLIKQVNDRISREQIDFNIKNFKKLSDFQENLEKNLSESEKFKKTKEEDFFRNYIKSIKFIPSFQKFGFGQYYLYIRPTNINLIDFKLLFLNTFQKVKYPAYIDNVQSLFLKYIFPYRNPNMSYINWLTKSKKIISEYCIFFIKKVFSIFQFDSNLLPQGWDLNANRFKTYMQKILSNPSLTQISIKEHNIDNYSVPDPTHFKNLKEITGWKYVDLKSILGTKNHTLIGKILNLIKEKLIFPYVKLKNLDFQDKIYIILPDLKKETISIIIKIFNFFNYGLIYEIEGKYYIQGLPEEIKFENGLFIKIYLPISEISEFQRMFNLLFQILNIKKYLILNDMVDGSQLIKNVHGNLNFLKDYNPLKNLIWNDKDKIWMNHKLFDENFEPIYPKLI